MPRFRSIISIGLSSFFILLFVTSCATQQGYQGAGVGAVTGATAGILLDPENRWRGAVIGGSLGSLFGGALTDIPRYNTSYSRPPDPYYQAHQNQGYYQGYPSYSQQNRANQGAVVGGLTGATAGALLDNNNSWRGALIGGALGSFFGGSIAAINSGPSIPVLRP